VARYFLAALVVACLAASAWADTTVPPEARAFFSDAETARETGDFQKAADLIIETAGPLGAHKGTTRIGNIDVNVLAPFYRARPATIYGGSNEIQRNILSKAVLGL